MEWIFRYFSLETVILSVTGLGILSQLLKPDKWRCLFVTQKLTNKMGDKEYFPLIKEKRKTNYGYILRIKCPVGITSENFIKCQTAIEEMLKSNVEISYNNGYVFIKVFERLLKNEYLYSKVELKDLQIPIGYSFKGLEIIDLAKGEPHMLIAGETGSGKSTLLRAIITNLILNKANVDLHLIDLKKGVEMALFKDCKAVKTFSRDSGEAEKNLLKIRKEVNRRYELFYENDCKDFDQYVKRHRLRRWLVVVDEFSLLAKDKESIQMLEELSAISRACGVHFILCTQRPDAKVITGLIKQNIPLVIGLKCLNGTNSRIIIDENGLEKLRGRGHGILKSGGTLTEFQSMFLDEDKANELLKPFRIKKEVARPKDPFEIFNVN